MSALLPAGPLQLLAGERRPGPRCERFTEAQQVAFGRTETTGSSQTVDGTPLRHWHQKGNRPASGRDFEGLTGLDRSEVLAGSLAQLPNADAPHVLHGST